MLRFACSFRKHLFSSKDFELGKKVSTETVDSNSSKFFQLVPLNGLEEALTAPENAVVVHQRLDRLHAALVKTQIWVFFNLGIFCISGKKSRAS